MYLHSRTRIIAVSLMCNLIYVSFFCVFSHFSLVTFICGCIHAILATILTTKLFEHFLQHEEYTIDLAFMTIFIACCYYTVSSVKYVYEPLYPGFDRGVLMRLAGSFFVFLSIYLSISIYNSGWRNYDAEKNLEIMPRGYLTKVVMWICIFACGYIFLYSFFSIQNGISQYLVEREIMTASEQFASVCIDLLVTSTAFFIAINYDKQNPITLIPASIFILLFASYTVLTGSRAVLMKNAAILAFVLILNRRIHGIVLLRIINTLPILMLALSALAFSVSNRYVNINRTVYEDIAYRFDLSDLSLAYLKGQGVLKFDFGVIRDGFINSIPSAILRVDKSQLVAYSSNLCNSGLNPRIDYTDSFFSMGTECMGLLGLLIQFPIVVRLVISIDRFLTKRKAKGMFMKVAVVGSIAKVEYTWLSFIPTIRNCLLLVALANMIYVVVVKKIGNDRHASVIEKNAA